MANENNTPDPIETFENLLEHPDSDQQPAVTAQSIPDDADPADRTGASSRCQTGPNAGRNVWCRRG